MQHRLPQLPSKQMLLWKRCTVIIEAAEVELAGFTDIRGAGGRLDVDHGSIGGQASTCTLAAATGGATITVTIIGGMTGTTGDVCTDLNGEWRNPLSLFL